MRVRFLVPVSLAVAVAACSPNACGVVDIADEAAEITPLPATPPAAVSPGPGAATPQPGSPGVPVTVPSLAQVEARAVTCGKQATEVGDWFTGIVLEPGKATPPPPSTLDAALSATRSLPRGDATTQLTGLYWRIMSRCPSARGVMDEVSAAARDEQLTVLAVNLPLALASCNCNVDFAELRSLLWEVNARLNPTTNPSGGPTAVGTATGAAAR